MAKDEEKKVDEEVGKKEESNKDDEEENKKKPRHKALKIIITMLLLLITIGVVIYFVMYVLITDKNKNTFVNKGITNQQIIEKEFVQGINDMNDNFEFKLNKDDVNTLLTNSFSINKESISSSKYVKNAYYDVIDNNHMWCFDLNVPVFTTRLVINTHIELMENASSKYVFLIDSMKIGKLYMDSTLKSGGYINDDALTTLFNGASLPIYSRLDEGYFEYNPIKFIEKFNLGEVTGELFNRINTPERLSVDSSYLGFKLNLDGVKLTSPKLNVETYDLPNELEGALLNKEVSDMPLVEETRVIEVNQDNFSKWINNFYDPNLVLEEIQSDLVNTKVEAKVKGVGVNFDNDHLTLEWTIKISNIYIKVSEDIGEDKGTYFDSFKNIFYRESNESALVSNLMDDFINVATSKGYLAYNSSNHALTFDFESVFSNPLLEEIKTSTWRRVSLFDNLFQFKVTRIF